MSQTLAMFHPGVIPDIPGIYGRMVAVDGFYDAYLRYGHYDAVHLFAPPDSEPEVQERVTQDLGSARGRRIHVHPYSSLLQGPPRPLTAWHEPRMDGAKLELVRWRFGGAAFP